MCFEKKEWKTRTCSVGEQCWCKEIHTIDDKTVIIGEGFIYKKFAEYVVKIHNAHIKNEKFYDWTASANVRSNNSEEFEFLTNVIAEIIYASAHDIVWGRIHSVAGLIVAHLAHKYKMIPTKQFKKEG